jgi:menaquinone-dependent protoporphyrinogen IX oxidase
MRNKIAVIYKSKYGATKRYAEWIADELKAELFEHKSVSPQQLSDNDIVIYVGGLYAGGIAGAGLVVKNPVQNLVVFTVGLANPMNTDYTEIIKRSGLPAQTRLFHFRGGIDYSKISFVHKTMMAMLKKTTLDKKSAAELTDEEKLFIDTYGKKVDFTDKATIKPLVDYVTGGE